MALTEHGPVHLTPGSWWTLETITGNTGRVTWTFQMPAGVHVKIRYGIGIFGWDSQRQLTDGVAPKRLSVSGWVVRARLQAGVHTPLVVGWTHGTEGPGNP
jgi:hypothetical protein